MADEISRDFPSGDPEFSLPDLPEPTTLPELPERLWTLFYDYGSVFSQGPIGQEVVWLFATAEVAEAARPQAEAAEPDAGTLAIGEATLEEIVERYATAIFVDEDGRSWELRFDSDNTAEGDGPLPDEPFALFVWGGGIDRNRDEHLEGEWVIHRDERGDYVLFFEDLDAAQQILKDFQEATGQRAEVRRTRASSLGQDQGVRFYHANGVWEDIDRGDYLRRCR